MRVEDGSKSWLFCSINTNNIGAAGKMWLKSLIVNLKLVRKDIVLGLSGGRPSARAQDSAPNSSWIRTCLPPLSPS